MRSFVEFEDKLKYERSPVVGASHAISIQDFEALSNYAYERNIEISPLVQGIGHASFILKHPEYKHLRDDSTSDWSFDPLNPKHTMSNSTFTGTQSRQLRMENIFM
jgi:hypothetical protein